MPRLLIAPAGHGKTEYILQRIRQLLADTPLAPVLVILPNAVQAGGFRQRLAAAGGVMGVEVYTFHSLYAELLTRTGQPLPLLTDPVRVRLLRLLMDDLCRQGEIRHYAKLHNKPGFIAALRNTIEELKRARILPEDFSRAAQGLEPRLGEIARVYSAYQDWLQAHGWADNEGRGWLAAIALESNPTLGADTRLLAVSGFDEFNPTQLAVLSLLANRAQEMLITLTGDVHNPTRAAHHRFHRAQQAIVSSLSLQPEAMDAASMLLGEIAKVEASLFQPVIASAAPAQSAARGKQSPENGGLPWAKCRPCNDIEFIEAQTRPAEARAALRWVKARLVRDGLAAGDVAVLARDLALYRPYLEEIAEEFGIPLRVVGGLPLAENPAVAALLSLLSLPARDWPRREVLEAWTSPYFDFPGREAASLLDAISHAAKVVKGQAQWQEAFELAKARQEIVDPESESKVSRLSAQSLETLQSEFQEFIDQLTPPRSASTREFVSFVENLIGENAPLPEEDGTGMRVVACARANPSTAGRDVAALQTFKDVLRGLALAESAIGEETSKYADFFTDLRRAVDATTYSLPAQGGVLAASALDARGLSFQAAVLMGLSEGEFPKPEREDILLRERDRDSLRARGLPLETRLHGDEATLFYQAVTRARQKLLLTRPYLAEDGQVWEASPFWDEVRRLNGSRPVVRVRAEAGLAEAAEAASQVEWRETVRDFDIHLKNGVEALEARLAPKAAGRYEGEVPGLEQRFGADYGWSASKLESYGTCPFEFFVAYALELEPRQEPEEGFDVRALGSMLHKILEDFYSGMELEQAAQAVFATAPQDYGFRPTPWWELQKAELLKRLEETVAALAEVSQGYKPLALEAMFGMGQPSLVLQTEAGEVRLHGYIDRIDAAEDGTLRVMDYKSGGATISAAHLREGRRLQLPVYALAAQKALGLGQVTSGFYWHIQKAEASSLKLEKFEDGVNSAFTLAIAHVGRHVAGIRAGRFGPKPPAEGCPGYCPAANFCWRFKRGF
jgi:ATP-dependent helicase/DNAse subunit B